MQTLVIEVRGGVVQEVPPVDIKKYQVTTTTLSDFQNNIDALSLVEQGPRAQKGMIKGANDRVTAQVEKLDEKKETLARLLPQLEDDFGAFVSAMRTAMVIVDAAAHRSAKTPSA